MKEKVSHIISKLRPKEVTSLLDSFLKDESISGRLILVAAALSLIVVNSSMFAVYADFWHTSFTIGIGSWDMALDLRHWLNEGLMAFFFLLVGLEIKRELAEGELKEFKNAILPIGAAIGGMIVPALIYLLFNAGTEGHSGWGVPIATDIAFAVAVLALLGKRVPPSLKIFLLTLAIADDIGAIIVIALFYAEIIHFGYLFASIAIVAVLISLRKRLMSRMYFIAIAGVTLWVTTHLSGIHASIVGAVIGLLLPVASNVPVSKKIEKLFLPLTTFVVLPLFAFANAGFVLATDALNGHQPILFGVMAGLVLGKVIGIVSASWLLTKTNIAELPRGIHWQHIIGIGFIAGIGFTVSIFITDLAFVDTPQLIDTAKLGIFLASITSAIVGSLILLKKNY